MTISSEKSAFLEREPILYASISGGLSGGIADGLMHSIDTIKTRLQGQLTTRVKKYRGITQSFRLIYMEEGLLGFYGGFFPALVGSALSTTAYFASYEAMKREFLERGINPSVAYFASGGLADVVASVIYVPSEVVKTRLQLQGRFNNPHSLSAHNYRSTYDALSTIYRKRGLSGLYYGWGATLLRDVPFTAIQFTIYETCKSWLIQNFCNGKREKLKTGHDMISGSLAGVVAGGVTTPLDVIKTYLQTQKRAPPRPSFLSTLPPPPPPTDTSSTPLKPISKTKPHPITSLSKTPPPAPGVLPKQAPAPYYPGIMSAAIGIYGHQGIKGLFAGVMPRMLWTGLQSTIMFVCYERGLELFAKYAGR